MSEAGAVREEDLLCLLEASSLRAYQLAAAMLRDRSEAEDALQEALERAWRHRRQIRSADRAEAWFMTIVANQCRRQLRAVRWRRLLSTGLLTPRETLPFPPDDDDTSTLRTALERLPLHQRTALILRYCFDLSIEDVAARTGVPVGTAKSRINRATVRLRSSMPALEACP